MNDNIMATIFWFVVAAAFLFLGLLVAIWRAGIQADVYVRQGVHMTTWEVFMGAKPAERTINVREAK